MKLNKKYTPVLLVILHFVVGSILIYKINFKTTDKIVDKFPVWIQAVGAKHEAVHQIVDQHMRMHKIHDMKKSKQAKLRNNPHYGKINKFAQMDSMVNRRKM